MKYDFFDKNRFLKLLKDPWYALLIDLEDLISIESYHFWHSKDMKTIHLPITTGSISSPMGLGSDSKPVKIRLEGKETYLADSMQFMLEYGCRLSQNGAYYIMPSFRGEKADKRHLCQFYHSEVEIPGDMNKAIEYAENYISFLCHKILDKISDKLEKQIGDIKHIEVVANCVNGLPRITFDECVQLLKNDPVYITQHESGFRTISHLGEQKLIELFSGFVWLTHQDHLSVPFYQAFDLNNYKTAICADLLFGIGEVIGLGQRHIDEVDLLSAMKYHDIPVDDYSWYIEMKRQKPLQTSGFGMGIERFILWVLKHNDIRDVQILPRFNGYNIEP